MLLPSQKKALLGVAVLAGLGIGLYFFTHKATDPNRAARRLVKNAMDPDAKDIDLTAKDTSVEKLIAENVPATVGTRVGPFEKSTWRLTGKIETIELKKDGDYYLVIKGKNGGTTVMEVPDPANCKGSPVEQSVAATRKVLEEKYHPTSDKKEVNEDATLTGVGFLGWGAPKSGSTSYAGPRLMPGTGVQFGS